MSTFQLSEDRKAGVVVLKASGELSLHDGPEGLRDSIHRLIDQGAKKIVLDLSQVPRIDSAGIGAIVSAYSSVRSAGGILVLANLTKRIADLLQITKLSTVFETYDTADEAVAKLASATPNAGG
jgi:anti-sigma B factor antagonist